MKLNDKDKAMVLSFIEREAKDYTPNKDRAWIDAVLARVVLELTPIKKAERIHIRSFGNAGCMLRELSFDANDCFDITAPSYIINLCTCGEVNHMVHKRFAEKKNNTR